MPRNPVLVDVERSADPDVSYQRVVATRLTRKVPSVLSLGAAEPAGQSRLADPVTRYTLPAVVSPVRDHPYPTREAEEGEDKGYSGFCAEPPSPRQTG